MVILPSVTVPLSSQWGLLPGSSSSSFYTYTRFIQGIHIGFGWGLLSTQAVVLGCGLDTGSERQGFLSVMFIIINPVHTAQGVHLHCPSRTQLIRGG